jgi:hypothetical protein
MVYKRIIGTRAEVWHGTAKKTSGGLTKNNLMMNKHGRIVSRSKHSTAKREMRLLKHGYGTKRGKFGYVKMGAKGTRGTKRRGSRKMRGGSGGIAYGSNGMSPAMYNSKAPMMGSSMPGMSGNGIDGQGITMYSGDNLQLAAGQAGGRRRRQRGGGLVYGANGMSPAMYNAKAPMMGSSMPGMNGSGIDGQGITMYSGDNLQLAAGQAGGRRRKRRGSKCQKGGTTMPIPSQNPGSPINMALGA